MCDDHGSDVPRDEGVGTGPGRRTLLRAGGGLLLGGGLVAAGATPAFAATSQNGWPAGTSAQLPLAGLTVGAASFPAGVRRGDVHTVLGYVARRFNAEVEALVKGWCWGHSYRVISGSTTLSNHASGTAIDCNAPRHPLGASGTFTSAQRTRIRAIVTACNGVVRWGGDYSGRKDEMHFEINVRPGDARLTALAAKIRGEASPTTRWSTVAKGQNGFRVVAVQRLLRHRGFTVAGDGSFGTATESAVKAFQRSVGVGQTGAVGPTTWPKLVVMVHQGSTGEAVRGCQHALTVRGYPCSVDGYFGATTAAKAMAFQRSRGLYPDGWVGPKTWAALTL